MRFEFAAGDDPATGADCRRNSVAAGPPGAPPCCPCCAFCACCCGCCCGGGGAACGSNVSTESGSSAEMTSGVDRGRASARPPCAGCGAVSGTGTRAVDPGAERERVVVDPAEKEKENKRTEQKSMKGPEKKLWILFVYWYSKALSCTCVRTGSIRYFYCSTSTITRKENVQMTSTRHRSAKGSGRSMHAR